MGFFQNLSSSVSSFIGNTVSGVTSAASAAVSGIVGGAVGAVGSAASQIVGAVTPLVTNVANSPAGSVLAAGFSGYSGSLPSNQTTPKNEANLTMVNAQGRIVRLDKLTGFAKFFCYYKMDAEGRVYLDGGQPSMNWGKVVAHVTVLGVVIYGVYKLLKRR